MTGVPVWRARVKILLVLALVFIMAKTGSWAEVPSGPLYVPGELIVKYRQPMTLKSNSSTGNTRTEVSASRSPWKLSAEQSSRTASLRTLDQRFGLCAVSPVFHGGAISATGTGTNGPDETKSATASGNTPDANSSSTPQPSAFLLSFDPSTDLEAVQAAYSADPNVLYAEPNYLGSLCYTPSDPLYAQTSADLNLVGMPAAWDVQASAGGSAPVVVAVIDSGIESYHPDLAPALDLANSWNFADNNAVIQDDTGHGSRVAGVIAAAANNGEGIAGIANGCTILSLDVATSSGVITAAKVASAINWAVVRGAKVINLSLRFSAESQTLRDACNAAYDAGTLLVAAAGNENQGDAPVYPASYESVIGVGAVMDDGSTRAPWSNFNGNALGTGSKIVDLAAPGTTIFSTIPGSQYNGTYGSGTSFAAPMVAGVAALLQAKYPDQSAAAIRDHILSTCAPSSAGGEEGNLGHGRLDAAAALQTPMNPRVVIRSVAVDDNKSYDADNDGDGALDKNETARLIVTLASEKAAARNVAVTLSTADTDIGPIADATADFDMVNHGKTIANSADPFSTVTVANVTVTKKVAFNLAVTADGGYSSNLFFELPIENEQVIFGVKSNQTFTNATTYHVTGNLSLRGNTVIQPGAVFKVDPGVDVRADATCNLSAVGTKEEPILFTAAKPFSSAGLSSSSNLGPHTEHVNLDVYQQVVYVSASMGSDMTGNGSQENPWESIQFALNQITDASGTKKYALLVAVGLYTWTGDQVVTMKDYVDLFGGYETLGWSRDIFAHASVIDGENTRRCVTGANNAQLDGFTIRRGNVNNDSFGGGVYCDTVSTSITNCIISDNLAGSGGGIDCINSSSMISNNVICRNFANSDSSHGGGIQCRESSSVSIMNNVISGNIAMAAGGVEIVSLSAVSNNIISGNAAIGYAGGGVLNWYGSSVSFNIISGNLATGWPGSGGIFDQCGTATNNNIIRANTSMGLGAGGIGCFGGPNTYSNNIIIENYGGGINGDYGGVPTTLNSVIRDNDWQGSGGIISHCNIAGNWGGSGDDNIDADPQFVGRIAGGVITQFTYEKDTVRTVLTTQESDLIPASLSGQVIEVDVCSYLVISNTENTIVVWGDATESGSLLAPQEWKIFDYHIKPTSPNRGAGIGPENPTYGEWISVNDVDGEARSGVTSDIGVDEFSTLSVPSTGNWGRLWITDSAAGAVLDHIVVEEGKGLLVEGTAGNAGRTFTVQEGIVSVAISPDGTKVLTGQGNTARLWDVATGNEIRTFTHQSPDGLRSVAFSPDGTEILIGGGWDCQAKLWDASTGNEIRSFAHGNYVHSAVFSSDGTRILTGGGGIKLWDTATGNEIRSFEGSSGWVWSLAFSPDGTKIVDGEESGIPKIWDVATGNIIRSFVGHSQSVRSVAFSPDGMRILTGGDDRTAKIWGVTTGNVVRTISGFANAVNSVAFSPDGTKILTGSSDGTAKLWDVAEGNLIFTITGHTNNVSAVAFSADGSKILTGSYDQTARLWGSGLSTEGRLFSNILARSNSDYGIQMAHVIAEITDSTATLNGGTGIDAPGQPLTRCTTEWNSGAGIVGAALAACTAYGNLENGLSGTSAVNSSAEFNGGDGLTITAGATNSVAINNRGRGIVSAGGNVNNCEVTRNTGRGLEISGGGRAIACAAIYNGGGGVKTDGSSVERCVVEGNTGVGVAGSGSSTLLNSRILGNTGAAVSGVTSVQNCAVADNGQGMSGATTVASGYIAGNTGDGVAQGAISNSTIVGNTGNGVNGFASLVNSWVVGNGATGVASSGAGAVSNSSILGNSGVGTLNIASLNGSRIYGNDRKNLSRGWQAQDSIAVGAGDRNFENNWWGASNTALLQAGAEFDNMTFLQDTLDGSGNWLFDVWPFRADAASSVPDTDLTPAFLLSVTPNNDNAVNVGWTTFTLTFSETMDFNPSSAMSITFGSTPPYEQRVVEPHPGWMPDGVTWRGRFAVQSDTGDGLNHLRVSDAVSADGFLIPDDTWHTFTIDTSGKGAANNGSAVATGGNSMNLSWTDSGLPATTMGFNVRRSATGAPGTYQKVNASILTGTNFTDTGLLPGTSYFYIVDMVDAESNATQWTPPFFAVTDPPPLTGSVVVHVTPNTASWSFTDGQGGAHSGTGEATVSDVPVGEITLTWNPMVGYTTPSPNPATQTLAKDGAVTFTGVYTINTYVLTTSATNGSVTRFPNLATYPHGTSVTLTAVPAVGYYFSGWTGDVTTETNPLVVTMDSNKTVEANFSINTFNEYALTVEAVHGSVAKSPDHAAYVEGTTVSLTATPAVGYHFTGWTGATTSTLNPLDVVMDATKTLTANFAINEYVLTLEAVKGSVTKSPEQSTYTHGTTVTLTATAGAGYHFTGWTSAVTSSANPLVLTMDSTKTLVANFALNEYALTVEATNGSVTKSPDHVTYAHGTTVTLTATPEAGYHFTGWTSDVTTSTNPLVVTMDSTKTLTATFVINAYTLTVEVTGTTGTVSVSPEQTPYTHGTTVTLTATPAVGYHFTGWSGSETSTDNPLMVTMDSTKTLTANFAINEYVLTLEAVKGSVTKSPDQTSYTHGTTVTLTATAGAGYHFAGWTSAVTSSANPLVLTMDSTKTLVANFALNEYALTVEATNGSVKKSPDHVTYAHGTTATLTAAPEAGYHFTGWTGDVTTSTNPLVVTMDSTKTLTATFAINTYALTVEVTGTTGTVSVSPEQTPYTHGTTVTLTATPAVGYHFTGWSGSETGTDNPLMVTMDSTKTLTANFAINEYVLTVDALNGSVAKSPNLATYTHGTTVTLTATPEAGYHFTGWTGSVTGSTNPLVVAMDSTKNLTANFAINEYGLTVEAENGSVSKSPDQSTYTHGTTVTLTATPLPGYRFVGWTGDAPAGSEKVNPLVLTMTSNRTIRAVFERIPPIPVWLISQANGRVTKWDFFHRTDTVFALNREGRSQIPGQS